MTTLNFDFLKNAKDSLKNAVHALTWSDESSSNKYKHAILSIFHCIELLLKAKLRQVNPALVWDNVDKYPLMSANTVGVNKAISRLRKIGNVEFTQLDIETIDTCRKLRNMIQHFEFEISEKQAKIAIGNTLSFIFGFSSKELDQDLKDDFKNDDTWVMLVNQLYEFTQAHGQRISEVMAEIGGPVGYCSYCDQETVDLIYEYCNLCGQNDESEENHRV